MRLQSGQVAPYFKRTDIGGNVVCLTDYVNQKLLLCFFRYAGCPWCNLAIHRLTEVQPELEAQGVRVVAFVQSPDSLIKEYILGRHMPVPPFPLIADPNREIYDLYGVQDSQAALVPSLAKAPDWIEATIGKGYRQRSS
jgi:thioredoxin-dependent peroxiredoxin